MNQAEEEYLRQILELLHEIRNQLSSISKTLDAVTSGNYIRTYESSDPF